jgi:hypothetical protein
VTQAPISEYRLIIDTDIGYHPILYPILTPISVVAVPDIGSPDKDPDINTDIGYAVYDIGDRFTRYRCVPDIGVNIGVNVTRYRVSSDMTRYRVT